MTTITTSTVLAMVLVATAAVLIGGLAVIPVIEQQQASADPDCKKQDGCIKVKVKKVKPIKDNV